MLKAFQRLERPKVKGSKCNHFSGYRMVRFPWKPLSVIQMTVSVITSSPVHRAVWTRYSELFIPQHTRPSRRSLMATELRWAAKVLKFHIWNTLCHSVTDSTSIFPVRNPGGLWQHLLHQRETALWKYRRQTLLLLLHRDASSSGSAIQRHKKPHLLDIYFWK